MRITRGQLNKVIREVVLQELGTGPGWDRERDVDQLCNMVGDSWRTMYDQNDPSMATLGDEAWEAQCSEAVEALRDEITNAIEEVETRLVQGEFYGR